MSDSPTIEQKKSRRGLLALVGAGGAAAVAALLGRKNGAEAAALYGDSDTGDPAVYGNNTGDGPGVKGSGIGVGVEGSGIGNGVYGHSTSATGVYGTSQSYIGVWGNCPNATGVKGTGKPGVYGISTTGAGVRGEGKDGADTVGVYAKNTPSRRALRTMGKVQMDCCRKKSLSNKDNLITLPSGTRAGSNAAVLATMQGNPGNDALIQRAYRVDSTHIRIVFNKRPARGTRVAYWVVHPA
jgi:hypothetical protein